MLRLLPQDHPQLFSFAEFISSSSGQAWLVGGTVRDLLLGQQPADYDIAFSGNLSTEIRSWSQRLHGSWFWLDKERNQSRVLLADGGLQFDFAQLRAKTIEEDLRLRDFTINAIALPLPLLSAGGLIDPLDGVADLQAGCLRSCSGDVLREDPLRCLKGVRHHAQHGWRFTPETIDQLGDAALLLDRVAGERLRTELAQILAAPHLTSAIRVLEETGLAQELFPTFREQKFQLEFVQVRRRLEKLSSHRQIGAQLKVEYEPLLTLRSLLVLALILACTAEFKPTVIERLRLSRRSGHLLNILLGSEAVQVDFNLQDSPRVCALKLERFGREPIARLLFALLHRQGSEQDSLSAEAIAHYSAHLKQGRVPDLLGGEVLTGRFPDLAGKAVGFWLERLKMAEIKGEINNVGEAEVWLRRQFSN